MTTFLYLTVWFTFTITTAARFINPEESVMKDLDMDPSRLMSKFHLVGKDVHCPNWVGDYALNQYPTVELCAQRCVKEFQSINFFVGLRIFGHHGDYCYCVPRSMPCDSLSRPSSGAHSYRFDICLKDSDCGKNELCFNDKCWCPQGYVKEGSHCKLKENAHILQEDRIVCPKTGGIQINLQKTDLPNFTNRSHLSLGSCPFQPDGSVTAEVGKCGLKAEIKDKSLVYSGKVHGYAEEGNITRRLPVKINVSCSYCCLPTKINIKTNQTIEMTTKFHLQIGEIHKKASLDVGTHHLVDVTLLNESGEEVKDAVDVNQNITIRIKGPIGIRVAAEKCWITDARKDSDSSVGHILVKDSCAADVSTYFKREGEETQKIHFRSFAFNNKPHNKLYIHCQVATCLAKEKCGTCNN